MGISSESPSLSSESSSTSFWSADDIDSSELEMAVYDDWRG